MKFVAARALQHESRDRITNGENTWPRRRQLRRAISREAPRRRQAAGVPVSKQTAGGVTGAVLGGVVAGPVVALAGGAVGAMVGDASAKGRSRSSARWMQFAMRSRAGVRKRPSRMLASGSNHWSNLKRRKRRPLPQVAVKKKKKGEASAPRKKKRAKKKARCCADPASCG